MVQSGAVPKNIFRRVEQIKIADIHYQAHGYFGLSGIGNVVNNVLSNPLVVSDLLSLANNPQEVQHFFDRVRSYMIAKAIYVSIKNISLNKLRLHQREYEWADTGGLIRNDGPTMIYLIFKSINPAKMIAVSTLKYLIEKSTLTKFGNNEKRPS